KKPIRLVLAYAGVDFVDKRYESSERDVWLSDKPNLGLDFPNLPYYMDGDTKMSQYMAILRHVARKHGLMARDGKELDLQEMVAEQITDIRLRFVFMVVYGPTDPDQVKQGYITGTLVPELDELVKFMGAKQWLTGKLSYYLARFEALPAIKTYQRSSQYIQWPVVIPIAKWCRAVWLSDKPNLGLDFPNIPYYMDGDLKISQSMAILKYLARKHGLVARDDRELIKQEIVAEQLSDIRMRFIMGVVFSPKDLADVKDGYITGSLIPQLDELVKFLGNKQWLTTKLSYVDFIAYEILDWFRLFTPETIAKYPVIG
ncbi:unnamed protein product, partial [Oppiella nova]